MSIRVCVVGGGTGGLEGLLSAHAQLGSKVELTLIAPDREFRYRPMSAASLFAPADERGLPITDVVAQTHATWVVDRVAAVHEAQGTLLSRDGDEVEFDFLLLALGARSERTLRQGHIWMRGSDPHFLDQILADVSAGRVRSVAVVVPRGARWPVPGYELALILAWTAGATGARCRVALITAEGRPLAALGHEAADTVFGELESAGVEVTTGVEVMDEESSDPAAPGPARIVLVPEEPASEDDALMGRPADPASAHPRASAVEFDRLISLPTVVGPFIAGVPTDVAGFVEVDEGLKVCGSERMWAAGACIAAALEHSALAAEQADAAVAAIAAAAAAAGIEAAAGNPTAAPDLAGFLLTGQRDRWLVENPAGTREPSTRCLWWPPGRAVGTMLAQRIAAWNPSLQNDLPGHPDGVAIRVPVALGCNGRSALGSGTEDSPEVRRARTRDIANRQLMAVHRREQAGQEELRALTARLKTLADQQQEVILELQKHGYLLDHHRSPSRRPPSST